MVDGTFRKIAKIATVTYEGTTNFIIYTLIDVTKNLILLDFGKFHT